MSDPIEIKNPIKPRKTPKRSEVEGWEADADRAMKYAEYEEARENHGTAKDHRERAARLQEAITVYRPIVELYEQADAIKRRLWTLRDALAELPECQVQIEARSGPLAMEREGLILKANKLLGAAHRR